MLLTTLVVVMVSAAPSLESWRAAGKQLTQSMLRDMKACEKPGVARDELEKCTDDATERAMQKYVETIRAGGAAMREVLRKERQDQDQREFLLELSEAALDPAEVAKRVRFTPDEQDRHSQRVTTLLQVGALSAWEAELRAVRPEWLRTDLGTIARQEDDAEKAAGLFERVAANQFLPDDVRVTARALGALRRAKLTVTTQDEMILRRCASAESSLALLRLATSCLQNPAPDAGSRCVEAQVLAGRSLPRGGFVVEARFREERPQWACVQSAGKSGLRVVEARAVSDDERRALEGVFAPPKP